MIFLRVLTKIFLWPHYSYSGAPGARGPRFNEPPELPVPTPLQNFKADIIRNISTVLERKIFSFHEYNMRNVEIIKDAV